MGSPIVRTKPGSSVTTSRRRPKIWRLALAILLTTSAVFAQTNFGRLSGTVLDQTGATVNGATVTVTDTQRGITRTLTTDSTGAYVAPDLLAATYKIHVEAQGFKAVDRVDVQLQVGQDIRVDITLPPGNVTETVVVSGEVPLLDTASATLGGTLSNEQINDLPLNGRNYENLLQLRPGVMRYPGGGFSTTSTNGLRAEDNAYIVDGLFNSEPFSGQSIINGAGIAGDSATILPIDSIQEFNLEENPKAEFGWKPGAIVNVGLKSGTNGLHGTAYAFGRDTPFDARNYFNCATVASCPAGVVPVAKIPRNLEQFGGSAGGPIIKDKLFFFGAYEGQRYTVGNTFLNPSPATVSLGNPATSIPDAIAGVIAAGLPVSAPSLSIAGCTLGPPVTCNGSGFLLNTTGTVNNGLPNNVTSNNGVAKIDYHPNAFNTISGLYFYGNNNGTVQDFPNEFQPEWLTQIHTRAQVGGGNWTWTPSGHWVNEARFGYNRLYQPTFTVDHDKTAADYGLNTGVTNPLFGGLPRITISGYGPQILGGFNWPKVQGPDQRYQFIDHVSYIHGAHAIKFGGELHRDSFTGGAYAGGRGRIYFGQVDAFAATATPGATPLEDFFAGVPGKAQVLTGDPTRNIHNWGFAGFVQDDWRATRNLTFNIGLRYELNTVIKEQNNLLGNFDPNLGLVQVGKQINSPYNGDHTNFAPRGGLAWDVAGDGKTVIRAGGGLFYETLNWESFLAFNNTLGLPSVPTGGVGVAPGGGNIAVGNITFFNSTPPAAPILNWNTGPVFPQGTINCSPVTGSPCTIMGVDKNLTTPYVSTWTVNVQHAFTNNVSLEVGYVGNHGTNLVGIHDINQPTVGAGWTPAAIAAGASDPNAEQAARPYNTKFPFLGTIYQMGNIYTSNYNGLQVALTTRNYHGLSTVLGYTYSHSIDDVGANWDFGYGSGLPQDSANPQREYASSDFDIRHRFTASITYLIPGRDGYGQMLKGWQLNSIVNLSSAQPWGPIDQGTDVSGTGELVDRWNFFGSPKDFKSTHNPIPYFAGASNSACAAKAASLDAGNPTPLNTDALNLFGCYAQGGSIMLPPALGTFGNMGRNFFRDSGFKNVDFSVAKNFAFTERLRAQFRVEFFNLFNHPNFANPYGGQNGYGQNDPSAPGSISPFAAGFGCGCATPDVAAANPVIGSGGARAVQIGMKLLF